MLLCLGFFLHQVTGQKARLIKVHQLGQIKKTNFCSVLGLWISFDFQMNLIIALKENLKTLNRAALSCPRPSPGCTGSLLSKVMSVFWIKSACLACQEAAYGLGFSPGFTPVPKLVSALICPTGLHRYLGVHTVQTGPQGIKFHPNTSCVIERGYNMAIGSFSLKSLLQFTEEMKKEETGEKLGPR